MDEEVQSEEQPREPKIDLVTGIGIALAMGTLDLFELIPFVGDFTSVPAFGVNFYLASKGINGLVFAIGNTLDFIPILQEFPCKTIGWLITWGIDHFAPAAVSEALEKAGEVAQLKAGRAAAKAAAGETAAAEGAAVTAGAGATAEAEAGATGGGETAARGASAEGGATGAEAAAKELEPEALGQERELLGKEGQLEKELLEETPKTAAPKAAEEDEEKGIRKKVEDIRKAKERLERILPKQEERQTQAEEEIEEEAA